jgi:hypothetical protein
LKKSFFVIVLLTVLFLGPISTQSAFSQFEKGGVDLPGSWYVGEGLKKGDYFSYRLCHVDYKECADFQMDFWMEGDTKVGTEDKWLVQAVVYDRNKIVKGTLELGKVAPEPTGGSLEPPAYRSALKNSVVWLSAFATSYGGEGGEGPKKFSAPSWGKIGNIGGQQVRPTEIQTTSVPAGIFETVLISWKTGGYTSNVWVVDDFPFPIKADTFTHVSEGIAPREYQFQLLDYKENIQQDPFSGIVATEVEQTATGCPQNYEFVSLKRATKNADYLLDIKYGPENPPPGCNIEWIINFKNKFDETEFLNQVQYDIFVVDENLSPLRSIAQDEGRPFLYSPSGQVRMFTNVMEDPGMAPYVIWIYGLSPENILPSAAPDYLQINIIPDWIKNNARWWATGLIGDSDFVTGIQFLINQDIMKIPPTAQGTGTGEIPGWIKNNAGWWADGLITDNDFVQGIQFLIENGIMKIG